MIITTYTETNFQNPDIHAEGKGLEKLLSNPLS